MSWLLFHTFVAPPARIHSARKLQANSYSLEQPRVARAEQPLRVLRSRERWLESWHPRPAMVVRTSPTGPVHKSKTAREIRGPSTGRGATGQGDFNGRKERKERIESEFRRSGSVSPASPLCALCAPCGRSFLVSRRAVLTNCRSRHKPPRLDGGHPDSRAKTPRRKEPLFRRARNRGLRLLGLRTQSGSWRPGVSARGMAVVSSHRPRPDSTRFSVS